MDATPPRRRPEDGMTHPFLQLSTNNNNDVETPPAPFSHRLVVPRLAAQVDRNSNAFGTEHPFHGLTPPFGMPPAMDSAPQLLLAATSTQSGALVAGVAIDNNNDTTNLALPLIPSLDSPAHGRLKLRRRVTPTSIVDDDDEEEEEKTAVLSDDEDVDEEIAALSLPRTRVLNNTTMAASGGAAASRSYATATASPFVLRFGEPTLAPAPFGGTRSTTPIVNLESSFKLLGGGNTNKPFSDASDEEESPKLANFGVEPKMTASVSVGATAKEQAPLQHHQLSFFQNICCKTGEETPGGGAASSVIMTSPVLNRAPSEGRRPLVRPLFALSPRGESLVPFIAAKKKRRVHTI